MAFTLKGDVKEYEKLLASILGLLKKRRLEETYLYMLVQKITSKGLLQRYVGYLKEKIDQRRVTQAVECIKIAEKELGNYYSKYLTEGDNSEDRKIEAETQLLTQVSNRIIARLKAKGFNISI